MYCANCGSVVTGNFCSNCGTSVPNQDSQTMSLNNPYIININGKEIDVNSIIRIYGTGIRKVGAYGFLASKAGISIKEAHAILDPLYSACGDCQSVGFVNSLKEQIHSAEEKPSKKQIEKERVKELKESKTPFCPKCHSTALTADKKGYGIGKGVIGGLAGVAIGGPVGLIGLTAGNIGSKKVRVTCMNCGKQFYL